MLDLAPTPLTAHPARSGTVYHRCDVTRPDEIATAFAHSPVDVLVHAAALTPSPQMERDQAATVIEVNLTGTSNLLQAAQSAGIRRLVHLSSAATYSSATRDGKTLAEDAELWPSSLYGITKDACERLVSLFSQNTDIK